MEIITISSIQILRISDGWSGTSYPTYGRKYSKSDELFCSCSGDEVIDVFNNLETHRKDVNLPLGILDLLNILDKNLEIINIEDIGADGIFLIEWCVDFLLFYRESNHEDPLFKKQFPSEFHKTKYITLNSFIYNYLKITNEGYKYWLMNALEWYKICEHGSGIRCAWFISCDKNPYKDRKLSEERKQLIIEWIKNAPDNI